MTRGVVSSQVILLVIVRMTFQQEIEIRLVFTSQDILSCIFQYLFMIWFLSTHPHIDITLSWVTFGSKITHDTENVLSIILEIKLFSYVCDITHLM